MNYFGTDGIRGIVDKDIDTSIAYNVGKAMSQYIKKHGNERVVYIGCDTRNSSFALVSAVSSGLTDYGIDVILLGIVSTPMVSFLTMKNNIGGAIMITASHNSKEYNGLKCFNRIGEKFDYEDEVELEKYMDSVLCKSKIKGKILCNFHEIEKYTQYILDVFKVDLKNNTIIIDCANGSNSYIAPQIYSLFGANIIKYACSPDGNNINDDCGANHIDNLLEEVQIHKADIGFAFDGDGDRLRIILQDGKILTGDEILYLFAWYFNKNIKLNHKSIVGTIMTNEGIVDALEHHSIKLYRSDVGDKNVVQMMKEKSIVLGGESSGHICMYEHNCTCDALMNSLMFLKIYNDVGIDEIMRIISEIHMYPSICKNITISDELRKRYDQDDTIKVRICRFISRYKHNRVVIRPSGTEPVIRLYVEGVDQSKNKSTMQNAIKLLKKLTNSQL